MDSYGIHATEMMSDNAASHVSDMNRIIRAHNANTLSNFGQKESNKVKSDKSSQEVAEGLLGKSIVGAGLALKSGMDLKAKYGSLGSAITKGTSENVYNLTGGKIGSGKVTPAVKMGGAEQDARSDALVAGKTPEEASERIGLAQKADVIGGDIEMGELSDHTKSIAVGAKMAAPEVSDIGLDLFGKTVKKGLTTIGTESNVATRIGAVAGSAVGLAGAVYTGVEDFGDGKWKQEGGLSRTGDVLSMAGGVLGAAASIAPILAPLAGIADLTGSILDLIGGHEDNKKSENSVDTNTPQLQTQIAQKSNAGQQAQQASQSSLQELSNRGGGGSY